MTALTPAAPTEGEVLEIVARALWNSTGDGDPEAWIGDARNVVNALTTAGLTLSAPGAGGEPWIEDVRSGRAAVVPARSGITPQMEVAADSEVTEQYRKSDWEEAKDMAEGLDVRAIYRAMLAASPYAKPLPAPPRAEG